MYVLADKDTLNSEIIYSLLRVANLYSQFSCIQRLVVLTIGRIKRSAL